MRIIGGKHKGRRFQAPKQNNPARPTTDIAKEGLFNTLNNIFDFDSISLLDLFGGTGAISYECSSRGAKDIVSVELWKPNADFIKKTSDEIDANIQVMNMDVFQYLASCNREFKLIFAGPPYPLERIPEIPEAIFSRNVLAEDGWLVLEHNPDHNFEKHPWFIRSKSYGTTIFSIFERPIS